MRIKQGKDNKRWYALFTKSRAEKKAESELIAKDVEVYLPLEKRLKQWSDRKKWIEVPLIRSYIFVRINKKELEKVFYTPGIVNVVTFEGVPAPIPDKQIQVIKDVLSSEEKFEVTSDHFEIGEKVEVTQGGLKGLQGEMIQHLNKYKVLIRLEVIHQNLLININPSYIKRMEQKV